MSKKLYSNVAISILLSLGVSACGSKGGSSPTSTDISQVNQIKKLKEQIEAEVKEKSKAVTSAEQAKAKAQAAANKAAQDLAKANQALENANVATAAEQAKAQAAAEKAAQDLAKANAALEASKAETAAEQAKAQAAANKAAQDLAKANQALENANVATAAEQAKAQAAAEKAAQDLAKANQALEASKAETAAEQAKAQAEAEKAARDLAALQEQYNNLVHKDEIERAKKEAELELAKERLKEAVAKREAYDLTDKSWRVLEINQGNKFSDGKVQYLGQKITKENTILITKQVDLSKEQVAHNIYYTSENIKVLDQKFKSGNVVSTEENVGNYHFINQEYSSYAHFNTYQIYNNTEETLNSNVNAAYVALPTKSASEFFRTEGKYTYNGYAFMGCCTDPANGNLSLDLYVKTTTPSFVRGQITIGNEEKFILDPADVSLTNPEEHFKGNAVYYYRQFTDDRDFRKHSNSFEYSGVFAGPNAEEIVGKVTSSSKNTRGSFGGKR